MSCPSSIFLGFLEVGYVGLRTICSELLMCLLPCFPEGAW